MSHKLPQKGSLGKLMAVDNVSGTLSLAKLPVGMYVAKVRGNGTNMVRAIQIK